MLFVACANGTAPIDLTDEGGLVEQEGGVEGGLPPPRDSGTTKDGGGGTDATTEDDAGACTGKVVINELRTGGASASDEFVEIYNPNTCAVPLGGWRIKYQSAGGGSSPAGYAFGAGDSIPAKSFFLIADTSFVGKKDGTLITGFAAASGQIGLEDSTSKLIDAVAYGSITGGDYREGTAAPAPPSGGSIARKVDGVDTNNNQADFKTVTTSTPGASN